MTHLACADEPEHPLNAAQAARFAAICARLPVAAPRSIANSSGMFLGPAFTSDLARPGCALYGINPTPGRPNPMRQAVRLDAPVLQVREIAPGDTVGYGATWTAERPSRVATVAAGYADGYLRALSGRAFGVFAGQSVPLIGRVSMDLIAFDVTDAPAVAPGAAMRLIGPENTPGRRWRRAPAPSATRSSPRSATATAASTARTDGSAPPRSAGGARSRRDRRLPRRRRRRAVRAGGDVALAAPALLRAGCSGAPSSRSRGSRCRWWR